MSDGITQMNRDGRLLRSLREVVVKWLTDEDFGEDLEDLKSLPCGMYNGMELASEFDKISMEEDKLGALEEAFGPDYRAEIERFVRYKQ